MNYWKISFGCLAGLVLAVASCSHPGGGGTGTGSGGSNGSGGSGSCTSGTLGCSCNGTSCDDGLSCASLPSGPTCVSTSSGSGGDAAAGGNGSGGAVSSGGNTGTGGAAGGGSTGTGGAATGGNTGSGGAAGSGSTGTGGAATGGNTGSGGSSSGTNLVVNGDFSQGMTDWNLTGSPSSSGVNNGEYCMMVTMAEGQIILGWGDSTTSLNLMANVNYTVSYQARASNGATVDVHIGQAVGSFALDKDLGNDSPGTGTQTFTHMFSITNADPQAGVAFLVSTSSTGGSMICFDNLVVTQN
ncbi:MAG TPA: carbohydrate binding domain-containing protein [Polyangia bacterium]